MNSLTLPLIILGALGDSINPCALAVLIFLVNFLISVRKRGSTFIKIGIVYILFIYITYFLVGIGLLSFIKNFGISGIVYQITAIAVIIAGLINIKDVFWKGHGFSLVIPASKKPIIQKYIQKASISAAIVLGILVSFIELPCTGGIYIAIIGLLAEQTTYLQGVLYLLFYNIIFVFPLILILLIANFSLSSETINAWQKKNKKGLRFIMGIVMVILGLIMLFF